MNSQDIRRAEFLRDEIGFTLNHQSFFKKVKCYDPFISEKYPLPKKRRKKRGWLATVFALSL